MKYNFIGNSGIRVSEISFGCMSLGEDHGENALLLHHALEHGINLFDTADIYNKGNNEITLGKAFKGMRDKVIISTKAGNQLRSDGSGWDWNPSKNYILGAAEETLRRLQTDYIDLYLLHGGTIEDPVSETIEAFEILQQQGKIRAWGISSIRPNVIREYALRSGISAVMMQYSLLDRRPEESCLELLKEKNISVLSRGSIAKGLLADKQPEPYLSYSAKEVAQAAGAVRAIARDLRTIPEVAVRFVLANPAVATAVWGIRTQKQLGDAIAAGNSLPLTEEELEQLRQVLKPLRYEQHR